MYKRQDILIRLYHLALNDNRGGNRSKFPHILGKIVKIVDVSFHLGICNKGTPSSVADKEALIHKPVHALADCSPADI